MKKFKTLTLLLAFFLTIGFAAAAPSNIDTTGQEETNNLENVNIEQTNFLQNIFRNALSVQALEDKVEPGQTQTFETLNTLDEDVQAEKLDFNIDVIYCGTECTDPPKGSCAVIGDVAAGEEDCIAHNVIDYNENFGGTLSQGTTYWTSFDYTIPSDAPDGKYLVQSFLYDRGDDRIASSFSNDYFVVETASTDGGDTNDPTDSVADPEITTYQPPTVEVNGDTVTGTVYLENVGGDMTTSNIVEMQVKTPENNFLSWVGTQSTCDPEHPATVNKPYKLGSGERASITLESSDLPEGEYDIVFVTATGCTVNGNGELTQPYSSWTDNYRETVTVGTEETGGDGMPVIPVIAGVLGASIIGVVIYRKL